MSVTPEQLEALGDQVQAACAASGLDIVGFTVLVMGAQDSLTAETRCRTTRPEYTRALAAYIDAEQTDPRADERPS
ncbi:hypothetical protein SEA_NICOLE72_6 [Microbacterium phage Nicole72]|uniref:Uncharacterized protein n=1 Tax=Microbacterium phage Nicole72 TaxID=3062838 RepID=A0ACD4UHB9_9CAUD|nr:hypothetical protein SEA_NICOLE72_6 [Microbacterium phage Nicole72]